MNTYCAVYELVPEKIDEYIRLHNDCWPEQMYALRVAGAEDLQIFINESQCIIIYECQDFDAFLEKLDADPINARWQKQMNGFFAQTIRLAGEKKIEPVKKVFSLKERLAGTI